MDDSAFNERNRLLQEAFHLSGNGPVDLQTLVNVIRQNAADNKLLASLYFAGSVGDHSYFIKNDKFAMGMSVFPGDIEKAGLLKSHAGQTEIVIVLEGDVIVEDENSLIELTAGKHYIINPGRKHRMLPGKEKNSAFLFIKTNPATEKPR